MNVFTYITPFIYFLLIAIWAYILYFYLRKIHKQKDEDKLILTLLIVLAIDAFRTLFESTIFGVRHTSLQGLIPIEIYNYLAQPQIVFIPKVINLIASFLILFIIIKKWIPAETSRHSYQVKLIEQHTQDLHKTIDHLNISQNDLQDQKQLFEIMYNTIPDGVIITDEQRKIILANKGMNSIFGYRPEDLIGKTTELLYPSKSKYEEAGKTLFNDEIKENGNFYLNDYKTKDNIEFPGETFKTTLFDKKGEQQGNLVIIRNVSERVAFINEINNQRDKAQEADRLKSAFLSNMSHELRTPMNGIIGFTTLIQEPDIDIEQRHEYLEMIKASGDRMLRTVNNIIEISKIETGQIDVKLCDVKISEQLAFLYDFFKPEVDNNNMQLILKNDLPPDEDHIQTDELKFVSILTNFIKNAIKYTHEGSITISCRKERQNLVFSVEDTGIGIEESRKEAIFDRFVQADIEDREAYEGSGLGLSIAKSYAETLNGKVWLESQLGKGSTFYFSLSNVENKEKH